MLTTDKNSKILSKVDLEINDCFQLTTTGYYLLSTFFSPQSVFNEWPKNSFLPRNIPRFAKRFPLKTLFVVSHSHWAGIYLFIYIISSPWNNKPSKESINLFSVCLLNYSKSGQIWIKINNIHEWCVEKKTRLHRIGAWRHLKKLPFAEELNTSTIQYFLSSSLKCNNFISP